jgi:FKBP-type peptidyl-prolyl cis-trans isomerase FklB
MRFVIPWLIAAILLFPVCSAADGPELRDQKDKVSYSIGYQIGRDFERQGMAIDPEAVVRGIQDALSGVKPPISQEEMGAAPQEMGKRPTETQRAEGQRR